MVTAPPAPTSWSVSLPASPARKPETAWSVSLPDPPTSVTDSTTLANVVWSSPPPRSMVMWMFGLTDVQVTSWFAVSCVQFGPALATGVADGSWNVTVDPDCDTVRLSAVLSPSLYVRPEEGSPLTVFAANAADGSAAIARATTSADARRARRDKPNMRYLLPGPRGGMTRRRRSRPCRPSRGGGWALGERVAMAAAPPPRSPRPAMGESVTEGTILEWHKQEGDPVEADEVLVEISTDKVDAEVPAPAAGVLVKIHAPEGETVQVGQLLAEIGTNGAAPAAPAAAPEAPAEAEIIDIVTPTGGESVTEGTILEWAVKVGDPVENGQTVVELSTDKVDMELPAPASGTITEILFDEGDTVTVGQVIARMAPGQGASAAAPAEAAPTAPAAPAPAAVPEGAHVSPVAAPPRPRPGARPGGAPFAPAAAAAPPGGGRRVNHNGGDGPGGRNRQARRPGGRGPGGGGARRAGRRRAAARRRGDARPLHG